MKWISMLEKTGNNTGCDNNDKKQPKECYIPDKQMASSPSISSVAVECVNNRICNFGGVDRRNGRYDCG